VTSRCKVAAAVVNYLMEKNCFFSVTLGWHCVPGHVKLTINEETFMSAILMLCLQHHYVGDGLVGLRLPTSALIDGSVPIALKLFSNAISISLRAYLSLRLASNLDSAEAAAACQ